MILQRIAVVVDPVEHDRGDREDHSRRCEAPLGEDMVDQAAVEAAVAVLVGVDIDEAEGGRRRLQDGIEIAFAHALVGREQAGDEVSQVFGARADELR